MSRKRKEQQVRSLQIRQRNRDYLEKTITYPVIELGGEWLRRHGFKPYDFVKVTIRHRLLVLEPEEIPDLGQFEIDIK